MSKSNKYGYSGVDIPTQERRANVGKFDPSEINELVADDKWSGAGQLELIQTESSFSGVSAVEFSDLGNYDVHLLTWSDITFTSDGRALGIRISIDGGASYYANYYMFAHKYIRGASTLYDYASTNVNELELHRFNGDQARENTNGYAWLYGFTKPQHSYAIAQTAYISEHGENAFYYGTGGRMGQNAVNNFKVGSFSGGNIASSIGFSLYGLRFSNGN